LNKKRKLALEDVKKVIPNVNTKVGEKKKDVKPKKQKKSTFTEEIFKDSKPTSERRSEKKRKQKMPVPDVKDKNEFPSLKV